MNSITFRGHTIHYASRPEFWTSLREENCWEPETFDVLDKYLGPGKVFLDLGAWNGVCSIYAAKLGALPYAVEPDEVALQEMIENMKVNELTYPFGCVAVWQDHEGAALFSNDKGFGSSMSTLWIGNQSENVKFIPTTTLQILFHFWQLKPDLIKMDIEASEVYVVPEAINVLEDSKCPLYISFHPEKYGDADKENLISALSKHYSDFEVVAKNQYLFLP